MISPTRNPGPWEQLWIGAVDTCGIDATISKLRDRLTSELSESRGRVFASTQPNIDLVFNNMGVLFRIMYVFLSILSLGTYGDAVNNQISSCLSHNTPDVQEAIGNPLAAVPYQRRSSPQSTPPTSPRATATKAPITDATGDTWTWNTQKKCWVSSTLVPGPNGKMTHPTQQNAPQPAPACLVG